MNLENFSNHLNLLVNKYTSSQWEFEELSTQNKPCYSPLKLQKLVISTVFSHIQEGKLTADILKTIPKGLQDIVVLEASSFNDLVLMKEFITNETAKQLLCRFRLSRNFLEKGTDREIFLRRMFEVTLSQVSTQEKIAIVENKRKLSIVNRSVYSCINLTEKLQVIVGKMMESRAAKIALTLLIFATTVAAFHVFYLARPDIITKIIYSYIKVLNSIPRALNITQSYRYFSLSLSILSGIASHLIRFQSPSFAKALKITCVISGFHWICAEMGAFVGLPVSEVLFILISATPTVSGFLLLPYLGPIILPVIAMVYTADSSTSLASRVLKATSEKLTTWRSNKELGEARDLWINSFFRSSLYTPSS